MCVGCTCICPLQMAQGHPFESDTTGVFMRCASIAREPGDSIFCMHGDRTMTMAHSSGRRRCRPICPTRWTVVLINRDTCPPLTAIEIGCIVARDAGGEWRPRSAYPADNQSPMTPGWVVEASFPPLPAAGGTLSPAPPIRASEPGPSPSATTSRPLPDRR